MPLIRGIRYFTLALMLLGLFYVFGRPEEFLDNRRLVVALMSGWIIFLFAVQGLATPDANGVTPLEAFWNRLTGKTWTCPRCGSPQPLHIRFCSPCGVTRPEPDDV